MTSLIIVQGFQFCSRWGEREREKEREEREREREERERWDDYHRKVAILVNNTAVSKKEDMEDGMHPQKEIKKKKMKSPSPEVASKNPIHS